MLKEYDVTITGRVTKTIRVTAENESQAQEYAHEQFSVTCDGEEKYNEDIDSVVEILSPAVAAEQAWIADMESRYFRTTGDTGASDNTLFIWSLVREKAGMSPLRMKDLPKLCAECRKYHPTGTPCPPAGSAPQR